MSIYQILNARLQTNYQDFPVFGLLLHSDQDSNGHMAIVLSKSDYLEKINIRSGPRWMIYCLKLLTPIVRPAKRSADDAVIRMLTMLPPLQLEEPHGNKEIMAWFNIRSHNDLPCIVVFAFDQHTNELLFIKQSIQGTTSSDTFNNVYTIVKDVSATLDEINEEYLANRAEIFHQVKETLAGKRETQIVKKLIGFANERDLLRRAARLVFGS